MNSRILLEVDERSNESLEEVYMKIEVPTVDVNGNDFLPARITMHTRPSKVTADMLKAYDCIVDDYDATYLHVQSFDRHNVPVT